LSVNTELSARAADRARGCPFDAAPGHEGADLNGPVARVRTPAGIDAWMVNRYEDVKDVLSDTTRFSSAAGSINHMLPRMWPPQPMEPGDFNRMDGAEHLRFRRAFGIEIGAAKRMDALRPSVQRIVDEALDAIAGAEQPVDFHERFSKPVTTAVIADLMDVPYADRQLFHDSAAAALDIEMDPEIATAAFDKLKAYVRTLLVDRRENPGDDALSHIIARSEAGDRPFTDDELESIGFALISAGFDVTAGMLTFILLTLFEFPDQMARLVEDPSLVPTAVDEFVRFLPGDVGILRRAVADTEMGGVQIKAGDYVIAGIGAAGHDGSVFPDPEKLDLARTPNSHLNFGRGPHACVGQQLARLELRVALETVLRRVPSLRCAVPVAEVPLRQDNIVPGPAHLPVLFDAVLPAGEETP
jgi:cytochrome P450